MVFLEWSIIVEIPQRDRKAIGLDWQNNNFARASRFLYISLQWLHDYDMKLPNFTFYGGRKHKTTTFLFFFWTSIQSFRIQLEKIANIRRTERGTISAIKFKATVAIVVAFKLPSIRQSGQTDSNVNSVIANWKIRISCSLFAQDGRKREIYKLFILSKDSLKAQVP